jgi:two-component system NtrC family sensor kinase
MTHLDGDRIASPFSGHHGRIYFNQLTRRIRWQLLLAYIIPLLLLSAFFHYHYDQTLRHGISAHLRSAAENKRNTVSLFLQERVANTKNAFHFDGLPASPDATSMAGALAELRRESPAFVDLGLFRPDGTLLAYAGPYPQLQGKDYGGQSWFRAVRASPQGVHISDVYLGFRRRPHFIVAVHRRVGGEDWTLRASVDPERFGSMVRRSLLLKDVEAFIVNRAGRRQTTTDGRVGALDMEHVPAPGPDTPVEEVDLGGRRYLAAHAWIPETDWALVVRIPTAIAYAPLQRARLILAGLLAVTLLLLVLWVNRSTRKIVGKLEHADRAKEELQGQLFNAAKLASVGEMAAGVAHEINNPLAIIYEEAGLLKDAMDPRYALELERESLAEGLDAIMEATMRGRSITSKLLAFARKHEAEPEPTDANELMTRALSIKSHEFKVSGVIVERYLARELPPILVNPNQLEQVLLNLLNNAKDAVGGPGRVTLRTRRRGGKVELEVEDDGCGMSPAQMEKIFFPFYTTKGVGKGTGLGLSISYGIVKSLGGNIEVRSEQGRGTTVTVILPAAAEAPRATAARAGKRGADVERDAASSGGWR